MGYFDKTITTGNFSEKISQKILSLPLFVSQRTFAFSTVLHSTPCAVMLPVSYSSCLSTLITTQNIDASMKITWQQLNFRYMNFTEFSQSWQNPKLVPEVFFIWQIPFSFKVSFYYYLWEGIARLSWWSSGRPLVSKKILLLLHLRISVSDVRYLWLPCSFWILSWFIRFSEFKERDYGKIPLISKWYHNS